MTPEIQLFFKVLQEVTRLFAPAIAVLLIMLGIAVTLILRYFLKRVDAIADEISEKSIDSFSRKLDVAFRDETLRANLRLELGQISYKKKLEMYDEVYKLYFEYQNCWSWSIATPKSEINALWKKVLEMRQKMFLVSIFLGPELTDFLFDAIIEMINCLQSMKFKPDGVETDHKTEFLITKSLDKAAKWLRENLVTHQDVRMYEFSDEQLKALDKERNRVFNATL